MKQISNIFKCSKQSLSSMRTLFRKNRFIIYLVDEFRISSRCFNCKGLTAKFKVMENLKPYRNGSLLVHGLIKCKSFSGVWNRDQ